MTTLPMKQGDTLPNLTVQLLGPTGAALDLTAATGVTFVMRSAAGVQLVRRAATVTTAAQGRVSFTWQAGDTDLIGEHDAEWIATFPGGKELTVPNRGYDKIAISARL
jgi:hypothetical protein